jgi:hypothetical protein
MRHFFLIALVALAGCSDSNSIDEELADMQRRDANSAVAGSELPTFQSTAQPVRIGEAGERFPACGSSGRVANVQDGGENYLPVRNAPFQNAAEVDRLANGDTLYICTRSLDQKWMGVVYGDDRAPDAPCGVSAQGIERRAYDGPCRSGWVSSAFIRLVG